MHDLLQEFYINLHERDEDFLLNSYHYLFRSPPLIRLKVYRLLPRKFPPPNFGRYLFEPYYTLGKLLSPNEGLT